MKVRFRGNETIFEGCVKRIAQNLILVQTEEQTKTQDTETIEVVENGKVTAKYEGFTTPYRETRKGMIFSNDGTVYAEQDETVQDTEQLRMAKLAEVSCRCETTIFSGIDITLADGSKEHISLTEKDQINLFGKQSQLAAGEKRLEYHEDGKLCRYYSAEDMKIIIEAAMKFVSYHTTYCNSLNAWIKDAKTVKELEGIRYGAEIPDRYKSEVLKNYEMEMKGRLT